MNYSIAFRYKLNQSVEPLETRGTASSPGLSSSTVAEGCGPGIEQSSRLGRPPAPASHLGDSESALQHTSLCCMKEDINSRQAGYKSQHVLSTVSNCQVVELKSRRYRLMFLAVQTASLRAGKG